MRSLLLSLVLLFSVLSGSAYSYWIWTPKSGKWVNPKTVVKPTPAEQFEYAKSLYDIKNYPEAYLAFTRLLKHYPKTTEAAESQYYLGRIDEERERYYDSFKAYQKVIDKYPFSERVQEIIEREYKIAEKFMSGEASKGLAAENPAIEIFTKVVENSTYGPLAPKAQYKLGLLLKSLLRYYEAEEAFNRVVSNYPDSEWTAAAKYQLAVTRAATSRGPDYDQGAAQTAQQQFEEFIKNHPDAALSREAEKNISDLREKEAQGNYNIGIFYEKQGQFESAKVYYDDIINNNPTSLWAAKALERLKVMEQRKKK